jgi:hypothetical protein
MFSICLWATATEAMIAAMMAVENCILKIEGGEVEFLVNLKMFKVVMMLKL